ncbi:hypothetical protein Bbelb_062680 [Branchiostoma belcheri]|nr:hypothetical protein Bbelb_062680 [Branchiostoma belcheri]
MGGALTFRNPDLGQLTHHGRRVSKPVASCGVVDRAFGAQQRSPGFEPGSEHGGMSEHAHRQGQVSNGSCLQLADESSARRAGVVKAELERNQVTGSSLQAPEPEPARLPRWIRWGRRMPKCVGLRFATCYPP